MSDQPTNGELAILLTGVKATVDDIKTQVVQTNGRVKSLELWKAFLLGAWAVITLLVPILFFQLSRQIDDFSDKIKDQITTAIDANNDKFFEKPFPNP